jgi:hypothetical protein
MYLVVTNVPVDDFLVECDYIVMDHWWVFLVTNRI